MVTATYEHIVIILLVGVIFIGTVVALPAINYSNFQAVDQQQLKNTTLNVFNSILLGVGSPPDWGSIFDSREIYTFGLAYYDPFSKYVLDSDKVQRLNPNSPGHITYAEVKDLLQLQGYGFHFGLYRPFRTVATLDIASNAAHFDVTVTSTQDGAPIPNAKIDIILFTTSLGSQGFSQEGPYFTDSLGRCAKPIPIGSSIFHAVAIMKITVAGMSSIVVAEDGYINVNEIIQMNTFGDTVAFSFRDPDREGWLSNAVRYLTDVWAYESEDVIRLFSGDVKINFGAGDTGSHTISGLSELTPSVLVAKLDILITPNRALALGIPQDVIDQHQGNRYSVSVVGPLSFDVEEDFFYFGFEPYAENIVSTMRRFVVISDMTYIAGITLWKEPL